MERSPRTCAPSDPPLPPWDEISWKKLEGRVRKLQNRIAKAFRERRINKAKALQYLLTRSLVAKALAASVSPRTPESPRRESTGLSGRRRNKRGTP